MALKNALYYARSVLIWLWFLACSAVVLCLLPFRWKDPDLGVLLGRLESWLGLKLLGLRIELIHGERLYLHQPCIYVGNHQSNFDVVTMGSIYPYRTIFIGKEEIKRIPVVGLLFIGMGNVFVKRQDRSKAVAKFHEARAAIVEKRRSVFIFPEGHRNFGSREMLPFKKGAFHMAIAAQAPIVPVVASHYMDVTTHRPRPGLRQVRIEVLEPVPTVGLTGTADEIARLMAEVRARMEKALD
jgi:1-acyl-sn-glycerol-3-phosphate acyltransferase